MVIYSLFKFLKVFYFSKKSKTKTKIENEEYTNKCQFINNLF